MPVSIALRAAALVVLTASVAGAESLGLVAVLPLDVANATISPADRIALEESIRTSAGDLLRPAGYSVLNGENTIALLRENGVDPVKACEAACALDAARELKATIFVSGTMATSEGAHIAFVRVFESATNTQLASARLEGATVRELRHQFDEKAAELFARVPGLKKATRSRGSAVREGRIGGDAEDFDVPAQDEVAVAFESEPAGAAVLVDGELVCARTPCRKALASGTYEVLMSMERYASARQTLVARKGAAVKLSLAPKFATLDVRSTPPGLDVTINGRSEGRTPLRKELDPGGYEVLVGDACRVPEGERVNVAAGDVRLIEVASRERQSAIRVSAQDADENVLDAEVLVDGEVVGRTPGTFKVPLCSKDLRVVTDAGERWTGALELEEKKVKDVVATFGRRAAPKSVPRVDPTPPRRDPDRAPGRPSYAVRAGVGGLTGVLGVGVEWRPSWFGVAFGTGTHLVSGGLTFGSPDNAGGFYADLHATLVRPGLVSAIPAGVSGTAFGATVGWDLRPLPQISLKAGLGAGVNSARSGHLVWDLNVGPVW